MSAPGHQETLDELLLEAARLRTRYGTELGHDRQLRLEASMTNHLYRIEHIRNQIEVLGEEAATLQRELLGYRKALTAYVADVVDRLLVEFGEMWSPTPVVGYRLWALHPNRLEGVRTVWPGPRLVATCATGEIDEVPHSDGRCGRLGCGIYGAKEPGPVLESFATDSRGFVAGRVEMTGKVVEHDTGYRAEMAEAVAVVAVGPEGVLATRDTETVRRLFSAPAQTMQDLPLESCWTHQMIAAYLSDTKEDPWTSASNVA